MCRIDPYFVYTLTLIISGLGLLRLKFGKFATELRPFIDVRIGMGYVILLWHPLSLPYNYFVSAQYLENECPEFDQILYAY